MSISVFTVYVSHCKESCKYFSFVVISALNFFLFNTLMYIELLEGEEIFKSNFCATNESAALKGDNFAVLP